MEIVAAEGEGEGKEMDKGKVCTGMVEEEGEIEDGAEDSDSVVVV